MHLGGKNHSSDGVCQRRRKAHQSRRRGQRNLLRIGKGRLIGPAAGAVDDGVGAQRLVAVGPYAHDALAPTQQPRHAGVRQHASPPAACSSQKRLAIHGWVDPAVVREIRHRRVADGANIDIGLKLAHASVVEPLHAVSPVLQRGDFAAIAIRVAPFPLQRAAAVPPRRGLELRAQCSMGMHARNVQVVVGTWMFVM